MHYLWGFSSCRPDGPPLAAGGVGQQLVLPDEAGSVGAEGREVEVPQGGEPVPGQVLHGQGGEALHGVGGEQSQGAGGTGSGISSERARWK